jgi:hypothetical protein
MRAARQKARLRPPTPKTEDRQRVQDAETEQVSLAKVQNITRAE